MGSQRDGLVHELGDGRHLVLGAAAQLTVGPRDVEDQPLRLTEGAP